MFERFLAASLMALCASVGLSQPGDEIYSIGFESVPPGTAMAGSEIDLQASVGVSGDLLVDGFVETAGGIVFPDGSMQFSAADSGVLSTLTANAGLYANRLAAFSPPNPYSELCFKGGQLLADVHVISEPPDGGQCEPGDLGWMIERDERASGSKLTWAEARADCLLTGMRLAEPFEWQISCLNAGDFGIDDMTNDLEWASNSAFVWDTGARSLVVPTLGNGSCTHASFRAIAASNGHNESYGFRCIR